MSVSKKNLVPPKLLKKLKKLYGGQFKKIWSKFDSHKQVNYILAKIFENSTNNSMSLYVYSTHRNMKQYNKGVKLLFSTKFIDKCVTSFCRLSFENQDDLKLLFPSFFLFFQILFYFSKVEKEKNHGRL